MNEEIIGMISRCIKLIESEGHSEENCENECLLQDMVRCGYITMISDKEWRVTLKGAEWYWKWQMIRAIAKDLRDS